jgi:glycosyltransferase involved in cell wall biosynthesis
MNFWVIHAQEPLPQPRSMATRRLWRSNTIAEMLADRGHEVVRWRSGYSHYEKRYLVRGSPREERDGYSFQFLEGPAYGRNIGFSRIRHHQAVAKDFAALAGRMEHRPDAIHVSNVPLELCREAVRFSREKGIPVVVDIRDLWPDLFLDLIPGWLAGLKPGVKWILRSSYADAGYAMRHATAITGITEPFVEWGLSLGGRARTPLDRVFHMSYPEPRREEDGPGMQRLREKLGLQGEDGVFCYFGAIGYQSDFDTLLQAARAMQGKAPGKFVICGTGPKLGRLKRKAAGLSNVIVPGWLEADEIQSLMRLSTVGLIPFKERDNYVLNMPNKFSEYLSGGLMIACGLKGEMARLVQANDCGFVYPAGDAATLAQKLAELPAAAARVLVMKENARALFQRQFNYRAVYGGLCDYLEELASFPARAGGRTRGGEAGR